MPVSDDLFDENQKLGIARKNIYMHFGTDGTTVYFDSIFPTQSYIMVFNNIIITGYMEKYPQ